MVKNVNEKNEEKKTEQGDVETKIITKETVCALVGVFTLLVFVIICTGASLFGDIGLAIRAFMTGVFGYFAYPLLLLATYISVCELFDKKIVKNKAAAALIMLAVILTGLLVHTALTFSWDLNTLAQEAYRAGADFPRVTVTGWVGAIIIYLLASVVSPVGTIVLLSLGILACAYFAYRSIQKHTGEQVSDNKTPNQPVQPVQKADPVGADIPLTIPIQPQPSGFVANTSTEPTPVTPVQPQTANMYTDVEVPQRPAFSIANEGQAQSNTGNGTYFSPFGTSAAQREAERAEEYQRAREQLLNTTPQESYQTNLIFDPNARINQRPTQPYVEKKVISDGYTPSYTNAYQDSLNTQNDRPIKIVSDQTFTSEQHNGYTPVQPDDLTPLPTLETHRFETPAVTPHLIEEPAEEPDETPVTRNDTYFGQSSGETARHEHMSLFSKENPNVFGNSEEDRAFARETFGTEDDTRTSSRETFLKEPVVDDFRQSRTDIVEENPVNRNGIDIFDEPEENPYTLKDDFTDRNADRYTQDPTPLPSRDRFTEEPASLPECETFIEEPAPLPERNRFEEPPVEKKVSVTPPAAVQQTPPSPPKPRVIRPYVRMPIDDFDCRDVEPTQNPEQVEETKRNIIATLENFKVTGATIASVTFGPTVTRYNVAIPGSISPKKVFALDEPLALCLHSDEVSISPNYQNGVISVEVPNNPRQFVNLGCMLTGDSYVNASPSSLIFTMGKDTGNRKVYGDISKMIHMLVAGSSGSGKSVFLGSLIISLIHKYSPEELRLILIDPKKTEFVLYNDLPHLMINEIITDANKAVQSLNWAIGEMNRRYTLFEQMSRKGTYVVNLDQYNSHVEKAEKLPKIVIIIDELADLMLAAKKEVEDRIQNLTQKARAAGIHLVVATQRPSTDVITGVIKSNLSTRIAFSVATDVDSRVILDQSGAQKLLGKGDFLYTMQGIKTPVRVQSAFISAEDSQRVVNFIKANNEAYYDESATAFINNSRGAGEGGGGFGQADVEPVFIEALRFVILSNSASISLIQRKCSIGYNKAGRIVEWMEEMGYVSSFDGAKARKVLITQEEFESKYGQL